MPWSLAPRWGWVLPACKLSFWCVRNKLLLIITSVMPWLYTSVISDPLTLPFSQYLINCQTYQFYLCSTAYLQLLLSSPAASATLIPFALPWTIGHGLTFIFSPLPPSSCMELVLGLKYDWLFCSKPLWLLVAFRINFEHRSLAPNLSPSSPLHVSATAACFWSLTLFHIFATLLSPWPWTSHLSTSRHRNLTRHEGPAQMPPPL